MGKKTSSNAVDFTLLSVALKEVKDLFPEAPLFAIREAVVTGKIASRKSSRKPKARYYVQPWALAEWYLNNK